MECLFPLGISVNLIQEVLNQLPGARLYKNSIYPWAQMLGLKSPEFVPDTVSYYGITISTYLAKRWTEERVGLLLSLIPSYLSWNAIGDRLQALPGRDVSGYEAQNFTYRFFPCLKRPSDLRQHVNEERRAIRAAEFKRIQEERKAEQDAIEKRLRFVQDRDRAELQAIRAQLEEADRRRKEKKKIKTEAQVVASECDAAFALLIDVDQERVRLDAARERRIATNAALHLNDMKRLNSEARRLEYNAAIAEAARRKTEQTRAPRQVQAERVKDERVKEERVKEERVKTGTQSRIAESSTPRRLNSTGGFVPPDAPNVLPTARADPASKGVRFSMMAMAGPDPLAEARRRQVAEGARGRV